MQQLNNKNKLFELLTQGATLITPNNRLSAALLQDFFKSCNKKTIDKPQCIPYSTFIIKTYESLKKNHPENNHPNLLNSTQCQYLWRSIIKASPHITYSEGLLKAVMQAWEHCEQWLINKELNSFNHTPQTRQFQLWWQEVDHQLKTINALCPQQILSYWLATDPQPLDTHPIVWVCFDDFNPQQLMLQNYLAQHNIEQYRYDLAPKKHQPSFLAANDTQDEHQQLVHWLRCKITEGQQRIALVVPNLEQKAKNLQRLLGQSFESTQFNISLGQSLNQFPLVAHALNWLTLNSDFLTHHQAVLLLQSPYIGYAKEEFTSRAHYLQHSILLQNHTIDHKQFINDLNNLAPKLAKLLQNLNPFPEQASIETWITLFHERLNVLGYPGDSELNSKNYQCFNRFSVIFDEFRQLNVLCALLNRQDAIEALTTVCTNTIFQPQSLQTPIQILGLLEASGCEYDSLWIMGLTDQCLPQKTHLSAFIPPQLQRELLMPHSLPERELHYAQQILQRLQGGSDLLVCSYPKLEGDSPNLPCSLIKEYQEFPRALLLEEITHSSLVAIEELYCLPIEREEPLTGGTALLANQAKCPFKAFAAHRLAAHTAPETSEGWDNKARGQIIHKVMELLWHRLQNQHTLVHIDSNTLNTWIDESILKALNPSFELQTKPILAQEVEQIRLKRLVLAHLEWEKQRAPFSIAALEQSYTLSLAGIDFKVRVDRLDQVEDNKWVIDYKTSLPTAKPWNEDRPSEPQLLMYALLDEAINTLLLTQLKTGQIMCTGLSEYKQDAPGIHSIKKETSWEQHKEHWKQQLTLLAEEFQQGHCPPQPLSATVCQQCDFQNLCRFQVHE